MFKKVSLKEVADRFGWDSWEEIKHIAAKESAGFVFASEEERETLEYKFNAQMNMSIENINQHGAATYRGETIERNHS